MHAQTSRQAPLQQQQQRQLQRQLQQQQASNSAAATFFHWWINVPAAQWIVMLFRFYFEKV